ncbi:MAG: hypothetical protein K0S44_2420 [Bacteroidetes bacterium]|jgi:hypothetical protein|nr:hypothetical protein [Bacteroidota bacterium]
MKKYTYTSLTLIFCFLLPVFNINGQGWEWKVPGKRTEIIKDKNNDIYTYTNISDQVNGNPLGVSIEKLFQAGTSAWIHNINGAFEITGCQVDASNNLILIGNLTSSFTAGTFTLSPKGNRSFFIVKISPSSVILSADVYGGTEETYANSISITSTGDYLIGGGFKGSFEMNGDTIQGDTFTNAFIIKADSLGNIVWAETTDFYVGGGEAWVDEVLETSSGKLYAIINMYGGYMVLNGYQLNSSTGQHIILLDNNHQVVFAELIGYEGISAWPRNSGLKTSGDTAYIKSLSSYHHSSSSIRMWLDNGTSMSAGWGGSNIGYDIANEKIYYASISVNDPDTGSYYFRKIGTINSDLDYTSQVYDSSLTTGGNFTGLEYINNNSLYIAGYNDGTNDYFVGKYMLSTSAGVADIKESEVSIYPNPTNNILNIDFSKFAGESVTVSIFNAVGGKLLERKVKKAIHAEKFDLSSCSAGVYLIKINSEKTSLSRRIVVK